MSKEKMFHSLITKLFIEAIINAFLHRLSEASDNACYEKNNIKIKFFPDKLKITNPGGIYKATLDDIMSGVQTYRNPGLINILSKLNYIENFGTGIIRILNSYKNTKFNPSFNPSENFFILTLPNVNYSNDPIDDPIDDPINYEMLHKLNQIDLDILKTIVNKPGLNSKQILSDLQSKNINLTIDIVKNSLKRKLNSLCEFKGSRNSGGYYLIKK